MNLTRPNPTRTRAGFALVTTLILLSALTVLVVGYFSMVTDEVRSSRRYADDHRAELACLAGFEHAKGILADLTDNDHFLVTAIPNKSTFVNNNNWHADNDSDPDDESQNRYYFISVPEDVGGGQPGSVTHVPLYAGGLVSSTSIYEGPRWSRDGSLPEANGVLGGLREFGMEDDDPDAGIYTDREGNFDDERYEEGRISRYKAFTSWVEPDPDADVRYTYWIEDMQGFPQFDSIGNQYPGDTGGNDWNTLAQSNGHYVATTSDPNDGYYDSYRPGFSPLDPRIGALGNPLDNYRVAGHPRLGGDGHMGIKFPESSYDPAGFTYDPNARSVPRQDFMRDITTGRITGQLATGLSPKEMRTASLWGGGGSFYRWSIRERRLGRIGGILSSASAGVIQTNRENRSTYGARPYQELAVIPKGLGYNTTVNGGLKLNLNRYTTTADIPTLASHMRQALPPDWAKRGGGFSMDPASAGASTTGPNDAVRANDYLTALATNMVDYIDLDNTPTILKNGAQETGTGLAGLRTWTRPDSRGIDACPVVNEFHLQMEIKELNEVLVGGVRTFEVWLEFTPHVEFWNPTNQATDDHTLGLLWWESVTSGGATQEVMQDFRVVTGNYGNVALSQDNVIPLPTANARQLEDVQLGGKGGTSVRDEDDLILWKNVGVFQPNQFKAFTFETVAYRLLFQDPTGILDPPNHFEFRGSRDGNNQSGSYDGKYMVLMQLGGDPANADEHLLIDQSLRGLYRLSGGQNGAALVWQDDALYSQKRNRYAMNEAAHTVLTSGQGAGSRWINPGDPFMSYWLWSRFKNISFEGGSSLGGRNYRPSYEGSYNNDNVTSKTQTIGNPDSNAAADSTWTGYDRSDDWTSMEVRPEHWPDGGYNTIRGTNLSDDQQQIALAGMAGTGYTTPDPWESMAGVDYDPRALAPYRLNNTGRWWSVTELGHIYDPIQWQENNTNNWRAYWIIDDGDGSNRPPNNHFGGGNTLRIGRPEHFRLRHDTWNNSQVEGEFTNPAEDWRAVKLIDIFHVGTNGSNVGDLADPDGYDPSYHVDPPTARTASQAGGWKFNHVWGDDLHAECDFRYINGHININSAVDIDTMWFMTDGPMVSDAGYGINIPERNYISGAGNEMEEQTWGAHRVTPGGERTRLFRSRPFYSMSQIHQIFERRPRPDLDGSRSDDWITNRWEPGTWQNPASHVDRDADGNITGRTIDREKRDEIPASDAVREEMFARLVNLGTLSSRNFRIFVMGEYLKTNPATGEKRPVAVASKVYEIFCRPVRNASNQIEEVKVEVLSERDF